ncbi:MAG: hypothetical protein WA116_05640 [Anaerolineaceae bacterium]
MPDTKVNSAPTATASGLTTSLPTPYIESASTSTLIESTLELTDESAPILNDCQSTVHVTPENNVGNPITEETRIMEILTGLSELELCNFPAKEGWLHRYDVINGKPDDSEFLAHLPGGSPSCDLQLWVKNENGKYLPMRLGDLRDNLQEGGYFVDLDEDGNLVRSERGPIQCDLRNGYSSLGTGRTPFFISGEVESLAHTYTLLKTGPDDLSIKAWFSVENGINKFVIEEYGQDLSGTQMYDSETATTVTLATQRTQYYFDISTGRHIKSVTEVTTTDNRIITDNTIHHMNFYEQLPEEFINALSTIESFKN